MHSSDKGLVQVHLYGVLLNSFFFFFPIEMKLYALAPHAFISLQVEDTVDSTERGDPVEMKVVIDHSDIIEETFWDKHQYILGEEHIRGN